MQHSSEFRKPQLSNLIGREHCSKNVVSRQDRRWSDIILYVRHVISIDIDGLCLWYSATFNKLSVILLRVTI